MNTQKQIFLIVVLFFMFTGGCAAYTAIDLTVRAPDQEGWQFDESVERGALLFANNCRTCHGNAGEGGVGPQVNREDWKNQDPIVLRNNKDLIRRTVTCGRAGTAMPTWGQSAGGPLNAVQVEHIVDFLTAPATEEDEEGNPTSKGWLEAVEFAHNLNHETVAGVAGDTLGSIAVAHRVGYQEVADANGVAIDAVFEEGERVRLPANREFPNGRTIKLLNDSTIEKVTEDFAVGAVIIAELNDIDYDLDRDTNTVTVRADGQDVPGLLPGDEIELPDGAQYVVRAGDTTESIAEIHNVSASEVEQLNPDFLGNLATDDEIPAERTLELPSGVVYITREGDTYSVVAQIHGLEDAALKAANPNIDLEASPALGERLALPDGTLYTIQRGDTLDSVAREHGMDDGGAQLAQLNNIEPGESIGTEVILDLPKVNAYVIQGQTLEDVADGFSNGDPADFAEVNGIEEDAVLRVGTRLVLPEDVWGGAPSTAVNPGTGCTQYTISAADYEKYDPNATPTAAATPPAQQSTNVTIAANSNDWTVTADGQAQPPNEGVVAVAPGTSINFTVNAGLHTITLDENGEETIENDDFAVGDTDSLTFNDAGTFKILCDFHPAMLAYVFVQEAGAAATPSGTQTPTATTTPAQ